MADWDRAYAEGEGTGLRMISNAEMIEFRRLVRPVRGQVAVDAGCGLGIFSRQLWQLGYDVTGLDWSRQALIRARTATGERRLRYLEHDLEAGSPPGLEPSSVDLVVCRHSLAYLIDRETFIDRVRDWLRPGGAMYVLTSVREKVPELWWPAGLTRAEIDGLGQGWDSVARYEPSRVGRTAGIVLRKDGAPAPES
ncbi:class I SAM-dependent methyltransferase [Streptomyces netropsis]